MTRHRSPILSATALLTCLAAFGAAAEACTDLVELSPFPCATDGTCPVDLSCNAGQCVKFCSTTTDCPEERVCVLSACLDICEVDEDCREGLLCSGGACVPTAPAAVCGNFTCEAGETCDNCLNDCPVCAECGNLVCEGGETCDSCPGDCACGACGDFSCTAGEDCVNCPNDCGQCPASCGDFSCVAGEDCSNCPNDCGLCAAECTLFAGQCPANETCIISGSVNSATTICDLVGGKGLGEPCFLQECGYDAVCWGTDPNFFCTQECDNFHPCAAGFCQPVTGLFDGAGVCQ